VEGPEKGCALAGIASVLLLASNASEAGFKLNYTVAPGTGSLAGNNIFSFYAKNDQTGEQAGSKTLLAMDMHFKIARQGFTFDFRDNDRDGLADANVFGKGLDQASASATFMRFGTSNGWLSAWPSTSTYSTAQGANPTVTYPLITDFNVAGFSQDSASALDATVGLGLFFGRAVVPAGVDVHAFGQMAAEKGRGVVAGPSLAAPGPIALSAGPEATSAFIAPATAASLEQGNFVPTDLVASAPEPGTLGLLGIATAALVGARRRRR
jgi:hypothetical protein